jgi:hypothetical protein
VESPEHRPRLGSMHKSLMGKEDGTPRQPGFPGDERGSEPSQAYRQDLKQRDDAIYVNL